MNKSLLALVFCLPILNTSAQTIRFGVVPQQSAQKLAQNWSPVLQKISDNSGLQIVFTTAKDIPTFEKRLSRGEYDVAYMNPYHYVVFHKTSGYQALAKQKDKSIRGIIVAPRHSEINNIDQLGSKRIAFPAPAAFAASILTQSALNERGLKYQSQYVLSHDSVYLNVTRGFFDAGGGVLQTLHNAPEKIQQQLKVIWTSEPYPPHAIATLSTMHQATRQKILKAMLKLNEEKDGLSLLKAMNFKGLEEAQNKDWDDVRALNLKRIDN